MNIHEMSLLSLSSVHITTWFNYSLLSIVHIPYCKHNESQFVDSEMDTSMHIELRLHDQPFTECVCVHVCECVLLCVLQYAWYILTLVMHWHICTRTEKPS